MTKLLFSLVLAAALPLAAQVETTVYSADLSPSLENPPVEGVEVSGTGTILITKMYTGDAVTSAIVDFHIVMNAAAEEQVTAFHIHRGAAGANGPVVVNPSFVGPRAVGPGPATVFQSTGVITDQAELDVLAAIEANPEDFYYNIHSMSNPRGLIRGQLRRSADTLLSMLLQRSADQETAVMMLLSGLSDAQTADAARDARIDRIEATVNAIARRLGIVPAQ